MFAFFFKKGVVGKYKEWIVSGILHHCESLEEGTVNSFFTIFVQDQPYPMKLPKLGHAVIINNIASEMPGSNEDVKALREAYQTVGFEVQVHENCTAQVDTF